MRASVGLLSIAVIATGSAEAAVFSSADICKAAIAVEMNRAVKSMKTDRPGDTPQISYRREDGDLFRYRCRLEGTRIIWSSYLRDEKVWGRWRNAYGDGDTHIAYAVDGNTLTIDDERSGSETFQRGDFLAQ